MLFATEGEDSLAAAPPQACLSAVVELPLIGLRMEGNYVGLKNDKLGAFSRQ
jgi:hypothetical protein